MLIKLADILIFSTLIFTAFLLIVNPIKANIKANRWFGLFLLMWASYWMDEIIFITSGVKITINKNIIVGFLQFFTPIVFFISVNFFTSPGNRFSSRSLLCLIVPIVYLGILLMDSDALYPLQLALVLVHSIFYSTFSLVKIRKHQGNIQQFASSTDDINLNWLEYIIYATIFLSILVTVFNMVFFELPLNVYINAIVLVVVYFIGYNALKQNEIFPKDKVIDEEVNSDKDEEEPKRQLISEQKLDIIKKDLDNLMMEKERYLDSDLNLIGLAKDLNITSHQLSYVINKGYSENFFQFVNKYRVEKAKRMLADDSKNNLSILGLAFESGFSSKTSFNTTFKKMTGQTPTEFKKVSSGL